MIFRASRMAGMFSWTKLLMPDTIELTERGINVTKKKLLGLSNSQEDVRWANVSSIRINNGVMLSTLVIETAGGATEDINIKGVKKKVAKQAREAIQAKCDC